MSSVSSTFIELPVHDLARAKRFYGAVFALRLSDLGTHQAQTTTGTSDLVLQSDPRERSTVPVVVMEVSDLAQAQEAVIQAGGHITRDIFAFSGGKRFHFTDPEGNELAAWRPD